MPILTLQKRSRQIGRIRIGKKGDKGQPQKLDRFRITSPSQAVIEKVAELYGGTAQPWDNGGSGEWEVITDARRIPIMVPPQPVSQWLETWAGGSKGCVHRCDGVTNMLTGEPCDPEDPDHVNAKPTTRLNVVLRDVEGIGVFRLDSHGWNAAIELPDVAEFLAQVGGYVNGWLSLEERVSKGNGQTRRFVVPSIEVDVTPAQLMAGQGRLQAAAPALGGGGSAAGELTVGQQSDAPDYKAEADAATDPEQIRNVWRTAAAVGHLSPELKQYLTDRAVHLEQAAAGEGSEVVEGELVDDQPQSQQSQQAWPPAEPDPGVVWQQILDVGGQLKLTLQQISADFTAVMGMAPGQASGGELQSYLDKIRAEGFSTVDAAAGVPA